MKRILFLGLLIIITILFICSCEPTRNSWDHNDLQESVSEVQLVDYENNNVDEIGNKEAPTKEFDINKMTVLETLEQETLQDFIAEFAEEFYVVDYPNKKDSPCGMCLRIVYKDGSFDVVTLTKEGQYSGKYNENGEVLEYFGYGVDPSYQSMKIIEKYFTIKLS